jgi:hypothetical protein
MGEKLLSLLKQPLIRVLLLIAVLSVLGGAGWRFYVTQQAPPPQPFEFRHDLHDRRGIQCLYCHPGAWTGQSSGLPTLSKCWGCHQQIEKDPEPPELAKLAQYVEDNEPIPWVPVAIQPDFVLYNHRPHIAAGLNCETCHGEVGEMTLAEPQRKMDMGWCLNCHIERAGDDHELKVRLIDCYTCHK